MRIFVDNDFGAKCEYFAADYDKAALLSIVEYPNAVRSIEKILTKRGRTSIRIDGQNHIKNYDEVYDCYKYTDQRTDITQALFVLKDRNEDHILSSYFILNHKREHRLNDAMLANEELRNSIYDTVYSKLNDYAPIPVQEDWMPLVTEKLIETGELRYCAMGYKRNTSVNISVVSLTVNMNRLIRTITQLLKNNEISINGSNTMSPDSGEVESLDSYLNKYSDLLAGKIKDSFQPKFDPKVDRYNYNLHYFDNQCKSDNFYMYAAQKDVAQSMSNHLDKNDVGFIIGEMGSGKTILSMASVFANLKKPYSTNVVLCPPHLVEKWESEILRRFPNSEAIIVKNFDHFMDLKSRIGQTEKHLFLVLSNSTAKMEYQLRPSVIWKQSRRSFCCPVCGQKLYSDEVDKQTKVAYKRYYTDEDFLKKLQKNSTCMNKVKKFNTTTGVYDEVDCNAQLWSPVTRDNDLSWIKLGRHGWVMKDRVDMLIEMYSSKESLTVKESDMIVALSKAKDDIENNTVSVTAPQRYQISKYLREYHKGEIDYLIADEIQDYKGGSSKQGEAFGDLVRSARKTVGLTGTLLNGYASSLFYLLFRSFPRDLIAKGYDYDSVGEFVKEYGVTKVSEKLAFEDNRQGKRIGSAKRKEMPGVSPLVFTDFLLDNAVFIGLEDIAEGLPSYTEIPIGIDMDTELKSQYQEVEQQARSLIGFNTSSGFKTVGAMLQLLSVYPDTPYNQPPLINPDTGEVLGAIPSLAKANRNKEEKLLELVEEKIANNEKVLIYYQWPNRSDVGDRLTELLNSKGIKAAHMTSSVTARKRESWINNKLENEGVQVVICTSALVETGLDLLEFTTIIFYQVGYNLFTLRQASRRSWRLSQPKPVEVYFLYYKETIQENALSLMANKLKAAMVIEGKFNEEGLHALSNEEDLMVQIASSVAKEIKHTVDDTTFDKASFKTEKVVDGSKVTYKKTQERVRYSNFSYFTPKPSYDNKKGAVQKYLSRLLSSKSSPYELVKDELNKEIVSL